MTNELLTTLAEVFGVILIAAGFAWFSLGLGLIAAGCGLIAVGYLAARPVAPAGGDDQ